MRGDTAQTIHVACSFTQVAKYVGTDQEHLRRCGCVCAHHKMKPQESTTLFVMFSPPASKDRGILTAKASHVKCDVPAKSSRSILGNRPEVERQTFFVNVMYSGWSQSNCKAPWCPFRVPKSFARDFVPELRTQSRVHITSFVYPLVSLLVLRRHDSSVCDLVYGLSCCVLDAHCKPVHSATRLIVFFRGQQQRYNCVYQERRTTWRTWRTRTNKRTCKQEELGELRCPQGDYWVLWRSTRRSASWVLLGCTLERKMSNNIAHSFPLRETLGSNTQTPSATLAPSSTRPSWVPTDSVFSPQGDRQHLPQSAVSRRETLDS